MASDDKSTWSLDDFLRDAGFAWETEERMAIHNAVREWLETYEGVGPFLTELTDVLKDFCEGY